MLLSRRLLVTIPGSSSLLSIQLIHTRICNHITFIQHCILNQPRRNHFTFKAATNNFNFQNYTQHFNETIGHCCTSLHKCKFHSSLITQSPVYRYNSLFATTLGHCNFLHNYLNIFLKRFLHLQMSINR